MCWGSFLNAFSYRLLHGQDIVISRSSCPKCQQAIAWYDLLPVVSWFLLRGSCRRCKQAISWLYPLIELITPLVMVPLILGTPLLYLPAYFLFFSALIVTIRSDLEMMLISRFVTLFLIPLGFAFSWFGLLPLNIWQSLAGAALGYSFLYLIATLFRIATGKEGMGQGDLELLAFIGSFTGIIGCWISLLVGSILGSLFGLTYMVISGKKKNVKIPFGPFLAFGAMTFILLNDLIPNIILF